MTLVQVTVPYKDNYDYGVGVDRASGSPMGKVVQGAISGVEGALGAITTFDISRIHTTSDLERKLGISVEASGGCGAFGASARMDYAKATSVQENSLFLAITASITLQTESIDEPALTASAAAIANRGDVFSARYGDMFVRGVGRGGMFVGILRIDTSTAEESEAIATSLEGSYGAFSAEAQVAFQEVKTKHRSELSVSVYHEGGPIDLIMGKLDNPDELYGMLQRWLAAFQEHPRENARPYYVTLAPIAIAEGPLPPNAAEMQHAQDILVLCAKARSKILDGRNLMDHILQNPARYDLTAPTSRADVAAAFAGYEADLDLVAATAALAMNDASKAVTPTEYAKQAGKVYPLGVPPVPMPSLRKGLNDTYATRGAQLANEDPLALALRERLPDGPARRGFDIGMGVAEGHTAPGPGKDKHGASLDPAEQVGFFKAVAFSVERNANFKWAAKGANICAADPLAAKAQRANPSVFYWLGFNIGAGIFGDLALGGDGHTSEGPGSSRIRDSLTADGQAGFRSAVELYLVTKHKAA